MPYKPKTVLFLLALSFAGAALVAARLSAQPGSESDPVVSLSYLRTSLSMQPVRLEGGEEFVVRSGKCVLLLEGRARIIPPYGERFWIVNVREGTVLTQAADMTPGAVYIPVCSDGEGRFMVQAWESSILALLGGSGE